MLFCSRNSSPRRTVRNVDDNEWLLVHCQGREFGRPQDLVELVGHTISFQRAEMERLVACPRYR